ncbi:DegT/DnrJ/EryC1/StrS family aminotransferase [Pontivivens ytuae]|uniref:DegT/DnrJ/EryC1/StrS family aminotransferase n=1 Tax=Pontivivens ytuae TaxID=2789856 RepID=A0A7S9QDW3_9RHOB|nr:DegT/DnrJ/EryC1/StrS family aminotransferase [Pontivivens ytuae]QPH54787.1 DegT/DnrJ/EryC1/StrS family aminotransferase [Pontivivens ytuae]
MLQEKIRSAKPAKAHGPTLHNRADLAAFGGPPALVDTEITRWPAARKKHLEALGRVVKSGKYHRVNHPLVSKLEQELSDWSGWWTARAVGSGTSALHIGLDYYASRGPKVVTAALNWPGAVGPIAFSGLTPEFVDVDLADASIDESAAIARVGKDVGAVLVTHLFGNRVDAPRLRRASRKAGAALIDDVAQAIAVLRTNADQRPLDSDMLALSGNGAKHLGAGELGFVLTKDPELIEHVDHVSLTSSARNGERIFSPDTCGYNYRPNVFSAALARSRLKRMNDQLRERQRNCLFLWEEICELPGLKPIFDPGDPRNSFLNMPLRLEPKELDLPETPQVRDYIIKLLQAEGVPLWVWLTQPVFEYLPAFRDRWSARDFPNTQKLLDTMFYISEIAPPNGKPLMRAYADAFHKVWAVLPSLRAEIRRSIIANEG